MGVMMKSSIYLFYRFTTTLRRMTAPYYSMLLALFMLVWQQTLSAQELTDSFAVEGMTEEMQRFWGGVIIGVVVFVVLIGLLVFFLRSNRPDDDPDEEIPEEDSDHIQYYHSDFGHCRLLIDTAEKQIRIDYEKIHKKALFQEIEAFEVIINANPMYKISRTNDHVFDEQAEGYLRDLLADVKNDPMSEENNRVIEVKISSHSGAEFAYAYVNFYYREGHRRLSGRSFEDTIEDLVLWCYLLNMVVQYAEPQDSVEETSSVSDTPINQEVESFSEQVSLAESEIKAPKKNVERVKDHSLDSLLELNISDDLADKLAKLAALKSQGYLTEEEFLQAKQQIINSNH